MKQAASLAIDLLAECRAHGVMLATAESCTGGGIVTCLTDIAGSSDVVDRGFVTYSNQAKMDMLGVSAATLERYGAVSEKTALEMAAGALNRSQAGIALSVTGIAGPGGGSPEKPVGLVWFGIAASGLPIHAEKRQFADQGRAFIRQQAVLTALQLGLDALARKKT